MTVVIASHDRPALLRRAVTGALDQTDAATEVVVVDDRSVPPAADGLADVIARNGNRLRVVRHDSSGGVSSARNHGLDAAEGLWIGFCDDDDVWAPTKVRDQVEAAVTAGASWSCSGALAVDRALHPLFAMRSPQDPATIADGLRRVNLVPGGASSVIARTEEVRALGGFDPALSTLADWDLWLRLARKGRLVSIDRPLVAYLVHSQGMSHDTTLLAEDLGRLRAKHGTGSHPPIDLDVHLWTSYVAYRQLQAGRQGDAVRTFARGALRARSPRLGAGALVASAAPRRALQRRAARARRQIPDSWIDEAQPWLDAVPQT